MQTLEPKMSVHIGPEGLDKNSIILCGATYALKLATLAFAVTTVSSIATWIAIAAGVTTIVYNGIKIYKELKNK